MEKLSFQSTHPWPERVYGLSMSSVLTVTVPGFHYYGLSKSYVLSYNDLFNIFSLLTT